MIPTPWPTLMPRFAPFAALCPSSLARRALLSLGALGIAACSKPAIQPGACARPDLGGCVIEDVVVVGNDRLSDGDIEERIATAETSHAFGGALEHVPILSIWDTLTVEYERFDRFVLERDLARVERLYRRKGYYDARARAGRVFRVPDGTVRVEIVVDEGRAVELGRVEIVPKDFRPPPPVSEEEAKAFARAMKEIQDAKNEFVAQKRFDEDAYDELKNRVLRIMTDRGFAYARVVGKARIDLRVYRAEVVLEAEFGPLCTFGDVTIRGLEIRDSDGKIREKLPEAPLRAALDLRRGQRYSTERLENAEYALADFGIFASVEVRPVLAPSGDSGPGGTAGATPKPGENAPPPPEPGSEEKPTAIPIEVNLQPAKLRTVKLGVGAQFGQRVSAHVVAGWEDRNFLGGLRTLSLEARPGVVFWPGLTPDLPPERLLPEVELSARGKQPNFPLPRWNSIGQAAFELRFRTPKPNPPPPEGVPTPCTPDEVDNLLGYRRYVGRVGAERRFGRLQQHYLFPFSQLEYNDPFSYNCSAPPPGFRGLVIQTLQLDSYLDFRRGRDGKFDKIEPHRGFYVGANLQYAFDPVVDAVFGEELGGVNDVRVQPEFRAYIPVSRKVTLAFRATTGVLFSFGYGGTLDAPAPRQGEGEAFEAFEGRRAAYQRDLQILELRGFFSGGPNSNRGYGFRGVGPQEVAGFFSFSDAELDSDISRATGGRTLWETSLELRIPLGGALSSAIFLDGSDVTRGVGQYRLRYPHLSSGFGLRYMTPVGPLRGDLGFRIPCAQKIGPGCPDLPPEEGAQGDFLGLPVVVSVAIGEAF